MYILSKRPLNYIVIDIWSNRQGGISSGSAFLANLKIHESQHEISNNVVCATSKGSDQPAHVRSLIRAYASHLNSMSDKLLAEHHLECISFKKGCTGSSDFSLVKIPHCLKSHVPAHIYNQPPGAEVYTFYRKNDL